MLKVRVHNVVIFANSLKPEFKACVYSYYVAKKQHAVTRFQNEYPERTILKVEDLGVMEVEFSPEKYRALYEDT
jgi:imidazoleglycerol phosphate synthase glutamine amidotransferase subunit HisH